MARGRASLLTGGLGLALGLAVGLLIADREQDDAAAGSSRDPSAPSSVDVGFCQDMLVHHSQAVDMSSAVLSSQNPQLRTVALQILSSQLAEIGQMQGYLDLWDEPALSSSGHLAWMDEPSDQPGDTAGGHDHDAMESEDQDHPSPGGTAPQPMPGMATADQLHALRTATGARQERIFLRLMLVHHQAGIAMATEATAQARSGPVKALAARMAFEQQEEIRVLQQMLIGLDG